MAGLLLGRARTLVLVTVGWVFFRATSLENAFSVLGRLFSGWAAPAQAVTFLNLSVGALAVFLVTALGADRVKRYALSKRMTDRGGVICCVFLTALTLLGAALGAGHGAENSFIYFNF